MEYQNPSEVSTPFQHTSTTYVSFGAQCYFRDTVLRGSQLLTYVCRQNVILPNQLGGTCSMMMTINYICTCHTCADDGSHNQISLHT